jgi:hypothetical protein
MKIEPKVTIIITILFLCATIMVILFNNDNRTILQESSGQICCKNIQSNVKNNAMLNGTMQLTSAKGYVVSLQENKGANFTWIAFGKWNASRINPNQTSFDAKFNMIKDDSSESHKYRITNFTLTDSSSNPVSITFNGTANIRLDSTVLHDVPISLRIMDTGGEQQTIKIWINPLAVQNHFGDTPIYGTVSKLVH